MTTKVIGDIKIGGNHEKIIFDYKTDGIIDIWIEDNRKYYELQRICGVYVAKELDMNESGQVLIMGIDDV
jgi:hypothetical protein